MPLDTYRVAHATRMNGSMLGGKYSIAVITFANFGRGFLVAAHFVVYADHIMPIGPQKS